MLKKVLLLNSVFALLALVIACSDTGGTDQGSDSYSSEEPMELVVTILGISETPNDDWFGFTVLAESVEGERMVFYHEHLEDIDISVGVGDEVKIVTNGDWSATDPKQGHVDSWSLVPLVEFQPASDLIINPELRNYLNMEVDISSTEQVLDVRIENNSNSNLVFTHPSIEYFDGEYWQRIGWHPDFINEESETMILILSGNDWQGSTMIDYFHSFYQQDLFRLRMQVFDESNQPNIGSTPHEHELTSEFRKP